MTDFKGTLTDVLTRMALEIRENYRQRLLRDDKTATGRLHDYQEPDVRVTDIDYSVAMTLPRHWAYVEYGRRKGAKMPPVDAISQWIKDKGIPYKRLDGLAWYIAKSIQKNGIEPTHHLEKSVDEVWERYRDRIDETIHDYAYAQVWEALKGKF